MLILLPFVLLIALNVGKLVKSIKQYRCEKRAEREELAARQKRENERIAEQARADREEVERFREELRRLKESGRVRTTKTKDNAPSGDVEISTSPLCFVDYARAL